MSSSLALFQRLHQRLMWPAAFAILLFLISGISHPIMVWTGPQASSFFPPQSAFSAEEFASIRSLTERHGIAKARVVKLVPGPDGNLLQVTESEDLPRRYFNPANGAELANFDQQQARWLAGFYTGRDDSDIQQIHFVDSFNQEYPAINRLLPVWRVDYQGSDNLTVYIHTETLSSAAMNNDWKRFLQTVFQLLHTQSGLKEAPGLQFVVMNILLLVLALFSIAGIGLIFAMPKRKKIPNSHRRWHRRLSLFLYVPLLMLISSGYYHLWYNQLAATASEQRLPTPLQLATIQLDQAVFDAAMAPYTGQSLNQLSLVADSQQRLYARLSVPAAKAGAAVSREQRFQGQSKQTGAIYIPLQQDSPALDEVSYSQQLASQWFASLQPAITVADSEQLAVKTVRFFEPSYDFRNKRLPVQKIQHQGMRLYIDTSTGILVETVDTAARYERLSFGMMHKWNWLVPMIGRFSRDLVVIAFIISMLGLLGFGITIRLKQKPRIGRGGKR